MFFRGVLYVGVSRGDTATVYWGYIGIMES